LAGVLRANKASVNVMPVAIETTHLRPARTRPFRPRARILAGPDRSGDSRSRVIALTGSLSDRTPPQRLTLDPAAAADRIVEQLRAWGYH
jgi:hypothetical protein